MSSQTDHEFVEQLRSMAAATPVIAVPGSATIVQAGRSRIARRRSIFAGAFGLALLAGAGLSTLPQLGVIGSVTPTAPMAAVAHLEPVSPLHSRAIPLDQAEVDALAAPLVDPGDFGQVDEADAPEALLVDASAQVGIRNLTPLATGLGIAGAASLGTAAGLALRSRRLQPARQAATYR